MKAIRNDGMGDRGVTFIPSSGSYTNVVIWMHGLGDTADGWASMMPSLGIVETKFVLPTAKNRPISLNMGMPMPGMKSKIVYYIDIELVPPPPILGWTDIRGLDPNSPEDVAGFAESGDRINNIIQAEVDKGIAPERIVVAGFSQGGALALHVALRSAHSLGGCIALSTWLPLRADYPAALSTANAALKILQVHGDEDRVVAYTSGKGSHEVLKDLISSPVPEFITIEGMGHSSDEEELAHVQRFLKSVFSQ